MGCVQGIWISEAPRSLGSSWVWEEKGAEPQTAGGWLSHTTAFQHGTAETENSQPKPDLPKVYPSM